MSTDAFEQLAEPIRRVLWEMRWIDLRPIQKRAIGVIAGSEHDLLISARTAAGKTEAAFLPILSHICDNPAESVRAVYVGPLKALINDQFRRIEDLCRHAEIPVHRWHGDVGSGQKKALLTRPSGVLLITPESIESLLVNQSSALESLFKHLAFVVIDELHSLIGCERGTHLRSLLHRLESLSDKPFRLVGLSATLGDLPLTTRWMRPDNPQNVEILEDVQSKKEIQFQILAYRKAEQTAENKHAPPEAMSLDMYRAFRDTKNLIFANAKKDVEIFGDQLNQYAEQEGLPERFLVHHGSLSQQIREHVEQQMQQDVPHTTVCSATLELGIDIGNVAAVGQIGCPWSVGSLVQRLGRSGRKDSQPHCLRLYVLEDKLAADSTLCERLFPDLLRSVALAELMFQKWVEPPDLPRYDFSTLTQQLLSVIAQTGGTSASELFDRLVTHGAFRGIDQAVFADLLRGLGKKDLIEQMDTGELILGLAGEKIVRHYSFYSAFATQAEYRVVHGSTELGTLPIRSLPKVGDQILFAGRRWMIGALDSQRQEITVAPAKGRKVPQFQGAEGIIHPRVREMMRSVLFAETLVDARSSINSETVKSIADQAKPDQAAADAAMARVPESYLNETGRAMLTAARQTAREAGLDRAPFVPLSEGGTLWLTWTGTRIHDTLLLLAKQAELKCKDHSGIALEFALSPSELQLALRQMLTSATDPIELASLHEPQQQRKYDEYIPEKLLTLGHAHDTLDVPGALRLLKEVAGVS